MIRRSFILIPLSFFFFACSPNKEETEPASLWDTPEWEEPNEELPAISEDPIQDSYTVETFEKSENDWGYRILNNGNLFINQPHIPAIQGNKGFSSEKKAETAANFMVWKLESGIVPPTVTIEELDSINVLN